MRDLVDIAGCESDCCDGKPKAEVRHINGGYSVYVGNNLIRSFDERSDDYAYTNARECAERWNAGA